MIKFFITLFLLFPFSALAERHSCTLGGSDFNPRSGASGGEVKNKEECVKLCEEELTIGYARFQGWREKAYRFRCAYDGVFIAFINRIPRPSDPEVIKKHDREEEALNKRLEAWSKKPQCKVTSDWDGTEGFLASSPNENEGSCFAFCQRTLAIYAKYPSFNKKVREAKCYFNRRQL